MAYQIFETADGQRTALYAQGNSVFSCRLPFMRGAAPRELRTDYLAHLDAVLFRDAVCFVYENLGHQVIIDTLGDSPARILLADIPGRVKEIYDAKGEPIKGRSAGRMVI